MNTTIRRTACSREAFSNKESRRDRQFDSKHDASNGIPFVCPAVPEISRKIGPGYEMAHRSKKNTQVQGWYVALQNSVDDSP
jgi:hypothetical protein